MIDEVTAVQDNMLQMQMLLQCCGDIVCYWGYLFYSDEMRTQQGLSLTGILTIMNLVLIYFSTRNTCAFKLTEDKTL